MDSPFGYGSARRSVSGFPNFRVSKLSIVGSGLLHIRRPTQDNLLAESRGSAWMLFQNRGFHILELGESRIEGDDFQA
jgi:hypothetical protein